MPTCERCGRSDHPTKRCYAKTDVKKNSNNNKLDKNINGGNSDTQSEYLVEEIDLTENPIQNSQLLALQESKLDDKNININNQNK